MSYFSNATAPNDGSGSGTGSDVVEISLLLPTPWADALVALSRRRRQSVGQILRDVIHEELVADRRQHAPAALCHRN